MDPAGLRTEEMLKVNRTVSHTHTKKIKYGNVFFVVKSILITTGKEIQFTFLQGLRASELFYAALSTSTAREIKVEIS